MDEQAGILGERPVFAAGRLVDAELRGGVRGDDARDLRADARAIALVEVDDGVEIEVVRRGAVRRAKLYYLRGRTGKAARIAERRTIQRDIPGGQGAQTEKGASAE